MKALYLIFIVLCITITPCFSQEKGLLIDDFEIQISGGPEGTVDFGAGNGSSVDVLASTDIKHSGNQSIKIIYDAQPGGYMYVAKGEGLEAKNASWLVKPKDLDWLKYNAFSFYMYGEDSKTPIAFDIKDNGNEMWRFMIEDNLSGWRQVTCPFGEFFVRSDWQPNDADKNATLDFPIKIFQFEPRPAAEAKKGTLYFDDVELILVSP